MSRVSNTLNMYFLLQARGMMKISEIAEDLEVTPRMIKEYKKDLEMAGIYIGSILGRHGGYYIENKRSLDYIGISKDETSALKMARESIKSGKFHYSSKFEIVITKILSYKAAVEETPYFNKNNIVADETIQREKKAWININLAINQKKKIKIEYKSLKDHGLEVKERLVEPYGIFDYKGATYFYGYCLQAEDIRFFKLSRIISHEIIQEGFKIKKEFNFDEVLERSFGIYNDEEIDLKLKIYYPMSEIIKEKQISKNQRINQLDPKTILFTAKMYGYTEIKSWIMSMGSSVEVLEPAQLKLEILEQVKEIIRIYK